MPLFFSFWGNRAYCTLASSPLPQPTGRPVWFTHNMLDYDETIQGTYSIIVLPTLLFFVDGILKRKLEDVSERTVRRYITRYTEV